MFNEKAIERVKIIQKKIDFIESIVKEKTSIQIALEDVVEQRLPIIKKSTEMILES